MNWELSLTIISLSFLLLTIIIVLFLIQMIKTVKFFETTLQIVNAKLPDILSDVHEITRNLSYASQALRGKIETLALALERVQKLSQFVDVLKPSIETPLLKVFGNLNALKKGFSIFMAALKPKTQGEPGPR